MSIHNNNKQFLVNQIVWIGISFGISLAISFVLPFPVSLVAIFGVFILLNMYMIKRIGNMGRGAMFGSMFGANQNSSSLKYYCMSCGTEHRQIACPKCGSKMKRIGY